MSFRKNWDVVSIESQIQQIVAQVRSPYNDGYTASACKHELWRIKCLIEDVYPTLPRFSDENEWQQQRTMDLLKRRS